MGENTKIEWADDSVGFWWGCKEHGVGCANCYARDGYPVAVAESQLGLRLWDSNKTGHDSRVPSVRMKVEGAAETLRRLDRKAAKEGKPRVVFINSQADTFEDTNALIVRRLLGRKADCDANDVPPTTYQIAHKFKGGIKWVHPISSAGCGLPLWTLDDERREMFDVIDECRNLRCLLLTKRPENVFTMLPPWQLNPELYEKTVAHIPGDIARRWKYRDNVWIGCSVSNQPEADKLIPGLLKLRDLTPVLYVSAEPLLGPIDFLYPPSLFPDGPRMCCDGRECGCHGMPVDPWPWLFPREQGIDLIIVGGESGSGARPCNVEDIRSIVRQCKDAGTACFTKQIGSRVRMSFTEWNDLTQGGISGSDRFTIEAEGSDLGIWQPTHPKGGDLSEWPADLRVRQIPGAKS